MHNNGNHLIQGGSLNLLFCIPKILHSQDEWVGIIVRYCQKFPMENKEMWVGVAFHVIA